MYCKNIPPSGVEECLKEHLGSIKSQRCRVVSYVEFFIDKLFRGSPT